MINQFSQAYSKVPDEPFSLKKKLTRKQGIKVPGSLCFKNQ